MSCWLVAGELVAFAKVEVQTHVSSRNAKALTKLGTTNDGGMVGQIWLCLYL